MLVALACIGLAQVGGAPSTLATNSHLREHRPLKVHRWRPDNQVDSENWSGYAVTGASFTQAMGSWVVPTANCSKSPASRSSNVYSSFWVGLDGYTSSTVEQVGTDSDCDYSREGSVATYYAWYEFYPADSFEIGGLTVSPGDKISAKVTYSGSKFTVSITDENTGETFSKTSSVNGAQRTSAEWIAEAPCCTRSGGFLPLTDFGTVNFGWDYTALPDTNYAADGSVSTSAAISAFGPTLCTQTNSTNCVSQINLVGVTGVAEDSASGLTSDGTSFKVTWSAE
jgi:hypothetical protein